MIIYSNVSNSEIALRSQAGIPISIMPGQSFIGPSYYKRYCDTNGIVAYTDKTKGEEQIPSRFRIAQFELPFDADANPEIAGCVEKVSITTSDNTVEIYDKINIFKMLDVFATDLTIECETESKSIKVYINNIKSDENEYLNPPIFVKYGKPFVISKSSDINRIYVLSKTGEVNSTESGRITVACSEAHVPVSDKILPVYKITIDNYTTSPYREKCNQIFHREERRNTSDILFDKPPIILPENYDIYPSDPYGMQKTELFYQKSAGTVTARQVDNYETGRIQNAPIINAKQLHSNNTMAHTSDNGEIKYSVVADCASKYNSHISLLVDTAKKATFRIIEKYKEQTVLPEIKITANPNLWIDSNSNIDISNRIINDNSYVYSSSAANHTIELTSYNNDYYTYTTQDEKWKTRQIQQNGETAIIIENTQYTISLNTTGNGKLTSDKNIVLGGETAIINVESDISSDYTNELNAFTINGVDALSSVVDGNCEITNIIKDTAISAEFIITCSVTTESDDFPVGCEISTSNTGKVNAGTEIIITAVEADGYKLISLTVDGTEITIEDGVLAYSYTVSKDTVVSAQFIATYSVTVESDDFPVGCEVTTSNTGKVNAGSEITITIVEADGYRLTSLTAGGTEITIEDGVLTYDHTVSKDTVISALFVATYSVTVENSDFPEGCSINTSNTGRVNAGTEITITAVEAEGYKLTSLTVEGTEITIEDGVLTYNYTVLEDITIVAIFSETTPE